MKIVIAEVATARDGLLASGIRQWLDGVGIEHETLDNPAGMARQPVEADNPADVIPSSRVKRGRPAGKKPAKSGKVSKPVKATKSAGGGRLVKAPTEKKAAARKAAPAAGPGDEAPRLTIRQRVMNILKAGGEMTSAQVHAELVKAGLSAIIDTGQHLYLLKRDGLVRFGPNEGYVLA